MNAAILTRFRLLAFALLALAAGACSNPVDDDHEEHPIGLVVTSQQGTELARFVTGTGVTGQISMPVGTTATLSVRAISEDGDAIVIDGDELTLQVAVEGAVGTATVQNANQLAVSATQAGTGAMRLTLLHEGHAEFSAPLVFVVTP